jgi:sortase A
LPAQPPDRLVIPQIELDSEIVPIGWDVQEQEGVITRVWQVADFVVSWHETSGYPGRVGNTVLNGHHNIKGEVFRYLVDLQPGDRVHVYAQEQRYTYAVTEKHILKEKGEPLDVRRENAGWIEPTDDERLTMITCWPYTNNTHRLVVIAKPVPTRDVEGLQE